MVIRGAIKINDTPGSGTGDPLLTRDTTDGAVGYVASIDGSAYVSNVLTSGNIIVGNGSNVATAVAMSGDATISNAGVVAIGTGVIVNADINASAAVALTKLAATTASRALVSDASGFVTPATTTATEIGYVNGVTSAIQTQLNAKQATITGAATTIATSNLTVSRALVSNGSGKVAVSATTSTEVGYLSGVTSAIQTQLNAKQAGIQFKDEGVNAGTSGAVTAVDFVGAGVVASHSGGTVTVTIAGTANGLPTGGTTGQVLIKNSATNYDASFADLVLADVSDVTATAAQVNVLATGYYDATSSVQTQINAKLSTALTNNFMFKGNASNVASAFATGGNGTYLSSVGGVPTWVTPSWTVASGGTGVTSYTVGDILYASGTTTLSKLGIGSSGQVLKVTGGVPVWTSLAAGSTTEVQFNSSGNLSSSSNFTFDTSTKRLVLTSGSYTITLDPDIIAGSDPSIVVGNGSNNQGIYNNAGVNNFFGNGGTVNFGNTFSGGVSGTSSGSVNYLGGLSNLGITAASPSSGNTNGGNITITTGTGSGTGINGTLLLTDGADRNMGVATLVAGSVTVNNELISANTRIFISCQSAGGTIGTWYVSARTVGTSFTISSSSGSDTSTIAWLLIEPN